MKKLIVVMLAVAMMVVIVGCAPSAPTASAPVDPTAVPVEPTTPAEPETPAESDVDNSPVEPVASTYKIGLMTSPLSKVEEYSRTAEMLMEKYGAEKFIMDVFPEDTQGEQEVTISKSLNIAMDPDVKVMIFDSADIGTIATVDKIKEVRPDMKFLFGSLNEDVYEMAKVGDLMWSIDPEMYGEAVAQFAADAGAKHFIFYSFARHMSNSIKVRYMEAMKATCEENGVQFEQVSMPDPMGDSGISGAQQFLIENIPSLMEQYDTKDIAYFATVSTIQESMLKTIVENGGIYPCHTDPSPFSAFSGALGLEIDDMHKFDADYVVNLISEKLATYDMNGRVGGWEQSLIRLEMETLFQYAIAYCEGNVNEVDGNPDPTVVMEIAKELYGETANIKNCVNDVTGEEYPNWFTIGRAMYAY